MESSNRTGCKRRGGLKFDDEEDMLYGENDVLHASGHDDLQPQANGKRAGRDAMATGSAISTESASTSSSSKGRKMFQGLKGFKGIKGIKGLKKAPVELVNIFTGRAGDSGEGGERISALSGCTEFDLAEADWANDSGRSADSHAEHDGGLKSGRRMPSINEVDASINDAIQSEQIGSASQSVSMSDAGSYVGTVRGSNNSASDQFEQRIRAKMTEANNGTPGTASAAHRRAESELPRTSSWTASMASASDHRRAASEMPNMSSALNQYENRIKAKMEEGNTTSKYAGTKTRASTEQKDELGDSTRALKPSALIRGDSELSSSSSNTASDQHAKSSPFTEDNDCLTPSMRYEQRVRKKMEKENNTTAKKASNSEDNKSIGMASGHHRQSNDVSITSMSASTSDKMSKYSAKSASGGSATASDQFEDRLKAKMAGENTARKPPQTSNTRFENRLKSKMDRESGKSNRSDSSMSASSASEQFENRLKAKMEGGNNDNSSKPGSERSSSNMSASSASEQFENRLKAKMEGGNNDNSSKPGWERSNATAGERFENRLRAKMEGKTAVNTRNDARVDKKMRADGGQSHRKTDPDAAFISKCAEEGNFNDILQFLRDTPGSSPNTISLALEKVQESFSMSHGIFDAKNGKQETTELQGNWVKMLADILSKHTTNEAIDETVLRTVWTIMALQPSELTTNEEGLKAIVIMAMKKYPRVDRIQECGSGIISYLAFNQKQALSLVSFEDGAVLERLGQALQSNSHSSLEALFRLMTACHEEGSSTEQIIKTIGQSSNREEENILTNAMDTVLGVMSVCPKVAAVQRWGCLLIWALLSDDCPPGSSTPKSDHNSLSAVLGKLIHQMEAITKTKITSRPMDEAMICLLSATASYPRDLLAGKEEVLSRIVVRVMIAHPNSHTVAMHGCFCIANMDHIPDDTVDVLLGVMKNFEDEPTAEIAIDAMASLTKQGYNTTIKLLRNEHTIGGIVGCMDKFPKSSTVQISAFDIFSAIALDRHSISEICSSGGASGIFSALDNLSNDRSVVLKAFAGLANLIGICDPSILLETKAPLCVLHAMEANPTDMAIQVQGITTLWNLSPSHASLKRDIIKFGGIDTICNVMERFIESQPVQEKGIIALWSLTDSVTLGPALISLAIDSIVDAIAAHLTSTAICEHGLGAISTLASKSVTDDPDAVIELTLSCMWMHCNSATTQQAALASLSKLAIDQQSNEVFELMPGDLDTILNAMRLHQNVKCVQENSILLLRSFMFCPANVQLFGSNPHLVALVKQALSNFQRTLRVGAAAEDLVRLLPSDGQ